MIKIQKIWKFIVYPVVIATINFLLIYLITKYYLSGIDVESILSDKALDFEPSISSIFNEESEVETGKVEKNNIEFPKANTEYGKIEIESVSMSASLIFGDTQEALKQGVGQYNGSYIPGYGGTILVTGHNYIFPQVENIKIGDVIKITTSYGVYKYKVSDLKVLDKDEYSSIQISDKQEKLIYYTCYPFTSFGDISTRYFVFADYISGPQIK
ncbi:MAG: class D sortase [Oscillospiraceae bacterium]|nr:class D sortase [Oscillospiraceae bacterium]